jgi:hypothetical protein
MNLENCTHRNWPNGRSRQSTRATAEHGTHSIHIDHHAQQGINHGNAVRTGLFHAVRDGHNVGDIG